MLRVLLILALLFSSSVAQSYQLLLDRGVIDCIPEDAKLAPQELVQKYGYPFESHYVTTEDGYILEMFRIEHGKTDNFEAADKKVVLLQHALLNSAHNYIANTEERALAFVLANNGYDVWMGNNRGNYFSRNHTTLNPNKDAAFWNFTFQEMGALDIRAEIQYIREVTGKKKIGYVGHSEGTIQMFYALAQDEAYISDRIYAYAALAPVARTGHLGSGILQLAAHSHISELFVALGVKEFGQREWFTSILAQFACQNLPVVCELFLMLGSDMEPSEDDMERAAVAMAYLPAGTSVKNMDHWSQLTTSKQFQRYDYGKEGNMRAYNQPTPPIVDLTVLQKVPIGLYAGSDDELADVSDVAWLRTQLSSEVLKDDKTYPMGHASFIVGKNSAYTFDVVAFLDKYAE